MIIECLVMEENERKFRTKHGEQREYSISLRDAGKEERCVSNLTYSLSSEEEDKFKGKLRDNKIKIVVKEIMSGFNGVIVLRGRIHEVPASVQKAA